MFIKIVFVLENNLKIGMNTIKVNCYNLLLEKNSISCCVHI
jgi:hypothetical protein